MTELASHPPFRVYAVVTVLLVLKMALVGTWTSILRLRRRVFATPEDYALQNVQPVGVADEDIERVRRAHRNDLENILPFIAVGLLYTLTGPSLGMARLYFWGFLVARTLHSIFYIRAMQPHRTIAFAVGALLSLAMQITTLVAFL